MAQSVERPTSAQVTILQYVSSSPGSGSVLTAQSLQPASDPGSLARSLSLSLSLPLPRSCSVSLTLKINIKIFFNVKPMPFDTYFTHFLHPFFFLHIPLMFNAVAFIIKIYPLILEVQVLNFDALKNKNDFSTTYMFN